MRTKWAGSGWGNLLRGKQVILGDVRVGDILLHESKQFGARNVVRVTHLDATGIKRNIFFGIFVHPDNHMKTRTGLKIKLPFALGEYGEFAVWDFDIPGNWFNLRRPS